MKYFKIILLCLLPIFMFNCSNDDENPTETIDPIIGKWKLIEITENGVQKEISGCESLDTIEFLIDGSINDTYFEPNGTDDCNKFIDNSGKWKKISESEYSIR